MKIYRYIVFFVFALVFLFNSNVLANGKNIPLPDAKPALKMGAKGDLVANLQKRLQELGYYPSSVDGQFGSGTFNAVYNFQQSNGLFADGVVGSQTIAMLNLPNDKIKLFNKDEVSRGASRRGLALVNFAKQFLNTNYVWGGNKPGGFDCSGFIYYVISQYGINLPRMADEQFYVGQHVEKSALQAGDLVFFTTYEPGPSHVGIYMGDGNFIHASSAAGEVTITSLSKQYYVDRYLGARRLPLR